MLPRRGPQHVENRSDPEAPSFIAAAGLQVGEHLVAVLVAKFSGIEVQQCANPFRYPHHLLALRTSPDARAALTMASSLSISAFAALRPARERR